MSDNEVLLGLGASAGYDKATGEKWAHRREGTPDRRQRERVLGPTGLSAGWVGALGLPHPEGSGWSVHG